jgi:hypothetical protein
MTKFCAGCGHFNDLSFQGNPPSGECRFNPPKLMSGEDEDYSAWPHVNGEDWCGRFQPRSNPVPPPPDPALRGRG